jgi:rhodanese-related sulfurtransferase
MLVDHSSVGGSSAIVSNSVEPSDLLALMNQGQAPLLWDVRPPARYDASAQTLVGAVRVAPNDVVNAGNAVPPNSRVVVFCVYGHQVSALAAQQLRGLGHDACLLAGGFEGGEDGADAPSDIARWRQNPLPRCHRDA